MSAIDHIFRLIVYIRVSGEEPVEPIRDPSTLDEYIGVLEDQRRRLNKQVGAVVGAERWSIARALIRLLSLPLAAEPLAPSLLRLAFVSMNFKPATTPRSQLAKEPERPTDCSKNQ